MITLPTEPIGSIPRPLEIIEKVKQLGDSEHPDLTPLYEEAVRDTIRRFEETGSPVVTDGEQRKYHNFWTYCVHGMPNTAPDGFKIPFAAGHVRRMPRLTGGPFRYRTCADTYLEVAQRYATVPVKQAVISPSALSLMYPEEGIPDYSREEFIGDLLHEHESEVRRCLEKGAHKVQIDFTEGRLAVKIDPTGNLLNSFIDLNNLALARFTPEERQRIGVHTCPGGDCDSTHSADVDYSELLPSLFELKAGNFYIALAGERNPEGILEIIRRHRKPDQRIFVGVISPIDPRIDTAREVCDRVLTAARYLPVEQLGTPNESYDLLELVDGRVIERFSRTQWIEDRNVGRVWSFRDITETKRSEQKLKEQSEWFSVTLGSIGDAVITADTGSRITYLNPVAEALTGWSCTEAGGGSVAKVMRLVNELTREPAENPIGRALAAGAVVGLGNHTTLIRRDGTEIPIEDSAAPIRNPAGEIIGAVMVFHDVHDRRQKELALARSYKAEQEARSAAEQASLAKDQFIAALSHELRTPLTPILAILSSLEQDGAIPGELAEDLETVRRNVELEARLIDDLLDLTRIAQGKLHLHHEKVSVGRVIEDAIKTCLVDLEAKHLQLVRDFRDPPPILRVDSARVTQILWNLLKNAIKFTPVEGTITLRLRLDRSAGGRHITIEVADTGIGMESSNLERVFLAFEQTDRNIARQFGGLGLGLAISRAIAEAHGGTLRAMSEGGNRGSTFALTLPCPERDESMASDTKRPRESSKVVSPLRGSALQRPLRILLVEDHVDTATILSRVLRRMGHDVLLAHSIRSAMEMAREEMVNDRIDLVMSDLGLPDGSGQDLMRALSTQYSLKGIALSGYGMESDVAQSLAAGFSRHLVKPVDVALLKSLITELTIN